MVIFNSYVSLPEGIGFLRTSEGLRMSSRPKDPGVASSSISKGIHSQQYDTISEAPKRDVNVG